MERIKEKTNRNTDFNCWFDSTGAGGIFDVESPLTAAVMNNDLEMMRFLIENGAFLDYRLGDGMQWKTPLHLAAIHNKAAALKVIRLT